MPKRKRVEERSVRQFEILYKEKPIQCQKHGDGTGLVFTHGAGGGMHAPATEDFVTGFAQVGTVLSFQGNMNLKSRVAMFGAVMEQEDDSALGGRSMGSRAAIMARSESTKALMLVSYPLIGSNGDRRDELLQGIEQDVLFIIGSKDKMCPLEELAKSRKGMKSWLIVVDGGMPGEREVRQMTGRLAAEWLQKRDETKTYLELRWTDDGPAYDGWTAE